MSVNSVCLCSSLHLQGASEASSSSPLTSNDTCGICLDSKPAALFHVIGAVRAPVLLHVRATGACKLGLHPRGSLTGPCNEAGKSTTHFHLKPSSHYGLLPCAGSCLHRYCRPCLQRHAQTVIRGRSYPVRCPDVGCTGLISSPECELLLSGSATDLAMYRQVRPAGAANDCVLQVFRCLRLIPCAALLLALR